MRPFTMRNTAARIGLPNRTRKVCSATRPTRPTGMVARMIIQARISSRVATRGCHRCQWRQRGEEAADDPDPVPPEVDQQRDRGGHVHAHDEGQVGGLGPGHVQVAGPAPADQRRDQHVVPQAGHREKLGHALDQADHASLEVRQMGHVDLPSPRDPAACLTLFDLPSAPARRWSKFQLRKLRPGAAPAGQGRVSASPAVADLVVTGRPPGAARGQRSGGGPISRV